MSKPINKTLLGGFVVCALALLVAAIVIFGSGQFFKKTETRVMYFEGSVKGLNVGAPVMFRGVKIGSVTEISLNFDTEKKEVEIPVIIEFDPGRFTVIGGREVVTAPEKNNEELIERGLRAQLEMQSFVTGQLLVAVDLFPGTPVKLHKNAPYPEIPTIPTPLQELTRKLESLPIEEILNKADLALDGIAKLVQSPELKESVANLNVTLKDVQSLVRNVDAQVKPLSAALSETIRDTQKLVKNMDSQVASVGANVNEAIGDGRKLIQKADGSVDHLQVGLVDMIDTATAAIKEAEKVLEEFQSAAKTDSILMYRVTESLHEVEKSARSLRTLTDYLERHPEALLSGKGEPGGN